jgi:hypothetical protein
MLPTARAKHCPKMNTDNQLLIEIKIEIDCNTVVVVGINTPVSILGRSSRQKSKGSVDLNCT